LNRIDIDGSLREWNGEDAPSIPITPVDSQGDDAGAALRLSHDGSTLSIGLSYPDRSPLPWIGPQEAGDGDRVELGLTVNGCSYRWMIAMDTRGALIRDAMLRHDPPLPIRAAWGFDISTRRSTWEIAVPLANIAGDPFSTRRIGLSLVVWDAGPGAGALQHRYQWGGALRRTQFVPPAHATVYLHPETRSANRNLLAIANALPDLPEATTYLLRALRIRSLAAGDLLDRCRAWLTEHSSNVTGHVLRAMDRELRIHDEIDPLPAILSTAASAGVDEKQRASYEREARATVSQWIRRAPGKRPHSVVLALKSKPGEEEDFWEHSVHWYNSPWGFSKPPLRAGYTLNEGTWQELRIPLLLFGLTGETIQGARFFQQGGEKLEWGPTSILIDETRIPVVAGDPSRNKYHGTWLWADGAPVPGGKTHSQPVPGGRFDIRSHAIEAFHPPPRIPGLYLHAPVLPDPPYDPREVRSILERHLPALGNSERAERIYESVRPIIAPTPRDRLQLDEWFVKSFPDHSHTPAVLGRMLEDHQAVGTPEPRRVLEALLRDAEVSPKTRYHYMRKYGQTDRYFIRTWQLLGVFDGPKQKDLDRVYPPEREGYCEKSYRGVHGAIRWRFHKTGGGYIGLDDPLESRNDSVAYAACWIRAPAPTRVLIAVGSDDRCKVWLNQEPILEDRARGDSRAGGPVDIVTLRPGWNPVLVKIYNDRGGWGFSCDLSDESGRSLPKDIEVTATPPSR